MMGELMNAAPCGFVSVGDDGAVLQVNDTLLHLLETDRASLQGKSLDRLLSAGARIFYQTHLLPLLKLQERVDEIYLVCQTGSGRDLAVLFYARRNERDGVKVNDCVLVPVGNRDRYEREILSARKNAETALALEHEIARARERVIGILGHDLRVPLTSISLGAELLIRAEGLDETSRTTALGVLSSARRASRMVADLLDFTRVRLAGGIPVRPRPANLREIARKIVDEVRSGAGSRRIDLMVEGDCTGSWDPDRMAQVVANLTRNAVEHGRIDTPVIVRLEGMDSAVALSVENSSDREPAPGEDLFSPWRERRDHAGDGLGLGLFIVKQVVEAHGGEVAVSFGDGRFAVRVLLPKRAPAE